VKKILQGSLFAAFAIAVSGGAHGADGCGTGCHATIAGACVVDGWATGAKVRNECPTTSRARPPCNGADFVWDRTKRACFQNNRDWY
jgi:hypothetical protein